MKGELIPDLVKQQFRDGKEKPAADPLDVTAGHDNSGIACCIYIEHGYDACTDVVFLLACVYGIRRGVTSKKGRGGEVSRF